MDNIILLLFVGHSLLLFYVHTTRPYTLRRNLLFPRVSPTTEATRTPIFRSARHPHPYVIAGIVLSIAFHYRDPVTLLSTSSARARTRSRVIRITPTSTGLRRKNSGRSPLPTAMSSGNDTRHRTVCRSYVTDKW